MLVDIEVDIEDSDWGLFYSEQFIIMEIALWVSKEDYYLISYIYLPTEFSVILLSLLKISKLKLLFKNCTEALISTKLVNYYSLIDFDMLYN